MEFVAWVPLHRDVVGDVAHHAVDASLLGSWVASFPVGDYKDDDGAVEEVHIHEVVEEVQVYLFQGWFVPVLLLHLVVVASA